ncbi:hypothetical protein [Pelagibacterium xiamenense]|uniref:hypothetical protein n=1 Tax=Pelagibacterium xiamenense TaxID=2901140 RepID=UPI001E2CEBC1|nr:hypothetical protein [Pelagibacterium xiamenense]MCD7060699.1 hypothetical protein [Pelagibacterium xiamenense]
MIAPFQPCVFAIMTFLAVTGAAAAQSEPVSPACHDAPDAWVDVTEARLAGDWQISMGPGILTMQGRTVPLPDPGDVQIAALEFAETALFISGGPIPEGEVELRPWRNGLNFDLPVGSVLGDEDIPSDPVTAFLKQHFGSDVAQNADIAAAAGCEVNALPQLHGSGIFQDPEGEVNFDLYLVVLSDFWIYGITVGTFNGGDGVARRVFEMRR